MAACKNFPQSGDSISTLLGSEIFLELIVVIF